MAFDIGTGFNNYVITSTIDTSGNIYVGGYFIEYNGTSVGYITKLLPNGSIDTSFVTGVGFDNYVSSIVIDNSGNLYIGGCFTSYKGIPCNSIVKLFPNGDIDSSFDLGTGFNSEVLKIYINADGDLLVGGSFTRYKSSDVYRLAKINTSGTLNTIFNNNIGDGFNNLIYSIDTDIDGNVYVSGVFTKFNDNNCLYICKLNSNGVVDSSFVSQINSYIFNEYVYTIKVIQGFLYAGGGFGNFNKIVKLNLTGVVNSTLDNIPSLGSGTVINIKSDADNNKYICGDFNINDMNYVIMLDSGDNINSNFNIDKGFNASITSTETYNDKVYCFGNFTEYNGISQNRAIELTSTPIPYLAPSGLTVTSIGDRQVCLKWTNNSENDGVVVEYKNKNISTWSIFTNISATSESSCVTNLEQYTDYNFRVGNKKGSLRLYSNIVSAKTTVTFPVDFCDGIHYQVTGTTNSSDNGTIAIDSIYLEYYNFNIVDNFGVNYTIVGNKFNNIPARWYTLYATPKYKWYWHFGNQPCIIDWIPLRNTNTTITQTYVSNRDANCGGFGSVKGRLVYGFEDSSASTNWSFTLYTEDHVEVNHQEITNISAITYTSKPGNYYGIIIDNLGYKYLINIVQVKAETMYNALPEITEIYLTEYNSTISYNYYSSSDEDWYVASLDPLAYTSTKIKEFINTGDWYKINLNTATITYNQGLNKGSNGLTYTETVNISIPQQEYTKWLELTNILTNSYIIVFKDANDKYWTVGYRNGTSVQSYKLSQNQYVFSFISNAVSKLLTNLDEEYVKLHIL